MRNGVEVRKNSIRIHFRFEGKARKETFKRHGNVVPPTNVNVKLAENFRGQVHMALVEGTFEYEKFFPDSPVARRSLGQSATVKQWYDHWLSILVISISTRKGYIRSANSYFLPEFGHRNLLDIKKAELDIWRAKLANKHRPKTVNNALIVARGTFSAAYENILSRKNPASALTNIRNPRRPEDEPDPFTYEEILQLCGNIEGNEDQESNLWKFWSLTGPRPGEIIALEWTDIDFENATARIQRNRVEGEERTPKAASDRFVDLVPEAISALRAQMKFTYSLSSKIFHNPRTHQPWHNDDVVYKALKRACRRTGVRERPPYCLRDTFACNMLSAGEYPYYVMEQLGHSTLQMLERSYGKWMRSGKKSQNQTAGEKFKDFVKINLQETP